ncbi:MAG: hypothetical protein E6H55_18705, partial [Betaproteobacteria bacterium]
VVRQKHDDLRRLAAHFVDDLLQLLFANTESPLRDEAARMRDRRIRKRLADNRDRDAVDLAQRVRRKHCVAEVRCPYILSDEIDVARELARYELFHALRAVSEFPVRGHHVDAEELRGLDHVLPLRPQSRRGALPSIAAVEDQRAGAVGLQSLDERRELGEASELAVQPRGVSEVEAGERVCVAGSRLDPETPQQRFADQMRNSSFRDTNAEIAFSPGFRWGTTLLPGQAITYEDVLAQTAITYPAVTVNTLTGTMIKTILEDVADNLFNPDPYYQQGGDMVRVGGLQYSCDPNAAMGARIGEMWLDGKPVEASRRYKVAGWAPVAEEAIGSDGEPVWALMARYLKAQKTIAPKAPNMPKRIGVAGNAGLT